MWAAQHLMYIQTDSACLLYEFRHTYAVPPTVDREGVANMVTGL